jgi:hypothetical protein
LNPEVLKAYLLSAIFLAVLPGVHLVEQLPLTFNPIYWERNLK